MITFDFTKYSDADPDPNFHVDADLDQDPDCLRHNADPHADPTPVLHMLENLISFTSGHSIAT